MRITARQLRHIIREELTRTMREGDGDETSQGAAALPSQRSSSGGLTPEAEDAINTNLATVSDFTIRRSGSGSWNEAYNAPGTGKIQWSAQGSLIFPMTWIGDDGKSFSILKALKNLGPNGEEVVGMSISTTNAKVPGLDQSSKLSVSSEQASSGLVPHITKKEFMVPAKLDVDGSPGGGRRERPAEMTLSFSAD